jgi:hypothetical protein
MNAGFYWSRFLVAVVYDWSEVAELIIDEFAAAILIY